MGLTFIEIEIGNIANPDKLETIEFLIDSGASISVAPETILKKLKIKPIREEKFILANGEIIRRMVGGAVFKYKNKTICSDVIFGEKDDHSLLGIITLEALGFALDPLKRELRPIPSLLA